METEEEIADLRTRLDQMVTNNNHFFLIIISMLVFFMQAGFAFLEAGSVRSKNTVNILIKNLLDTLVGGIAYWAVGWGLAYGAGGNPFFGGSEFFSKDLELDLYSKWLFQFVFAATASTILSGSISERCQFGAYFIYSFVITGIVYPPVSHWAWDGGRDFKRNVSATLNLGEGVWEWEGECGNGSIPMEYEDGLDNETMREMEVDFTSGTGWLACTGQYQDFAGSGVVHLLGGTCALVACFFIGARAGRFKNGQSVDMPGHSVPLAALGGFILIFGFMAFNGGSQAQINSDPSDGATIGLVVVNTILGGCSGGLTVLFLIRLKGTSWSFLMALNGTLSGMVSLCAGCNMYEPWQALLVGIGGGVCYLAGHFAMLRVKLDDPIDAVSVHGAAGLWGLLIAPFFAGFGSLTYNIIGAAAVILWSSIWSVAIFYPLSCLKLLRIPEEMEEQGIDIAKHGEAAYPSSAWEEEQYNNASNAPSHMRVARTDHLPETYNRMEMGNTTGQLNLDVNGAIKGAGHVSGVALTGYADLNGHLYNKYNDSKEKADPIRLEAVDFKEGTPYKSVGKTDDRKEKTDLNKESFYVGMDKVDGNTELAYKDVDKTDVSGQNAHKLSGQSAHKVVMMCLETDEEVMDQCDSCDSNMETVPKGPNKTVNRDMDETDSKKETIHNSTEATDNKAFELGE